LDLQVRRFFEAGGKPICSKTNENRGMRKVVEEADFFFTHINFITSKLKV
tara:strand:+ start:6466 stop:6615 length:150 start_codon:yes stop_codon:yes gene_type:complete